MVASDGPLRSRILNLAWQRFADKGFGETLMADIARDCGVELQQVFAEFPRKEDLVFELYRRLAVQLEERVVELPEGTLVERFHFIIDHKIASLREHRPVLKALFETMTDAEQDLGVMSEHMELVRRRVRGIFAAVAWGATDRPADEKVPELVRYLYRLHLGLVLLWLHNATAYRLARKGIGPLLRVGKTAWTFSPLQVVTERVDGLLQRSVETHDSHGDLADQILHRLFRHRRLQAHASSDCATSPCQQCFALHRSRMETFIAKGQPIEMVLPAFPAKSPNRSKVLGHLPDTAEELALRSLDNICREIGEIYQPGARIVICSDGHVFNDLVGVHEADVEVYNATIREMIENNGLDSLSCFELSDVAEPGPLDVETILAPYLEPLDSLIERVKGYEVHKQLFNGLHRFLFEDQVVLQSHLSKNLVRQNCKTLAYLVMQRSNAWGRLIGQEFPDALRLSIHPQSPHSDKIGVQLSPAIDTWVTPWHGVALLSDDNFLLVKREHAEKAGAEIVYQNGRPIHFAVVKE